MTFSMGGDPPNPPPRAPVRAAPRTFPPRAALVHGVLVSSAIVVAVSCGGNVVVDPTPRSSGGQGGASNNIASSTTTSLGGSTESLVTVVASSSSFMAQVASSTTTLVTDATSSSSVTTTSSSSSGAIVISDTPSSFLQSETSVATFGPIVAVAWIDVTGSGFSSIGYTFSTNDGASFGPVGLVKSPGGRLSSDPTVVVDAAQNFWLAWVGFHADAMGNVSDMHIYVSEAPAGSTTFGAPVEVSDPADTTSLLDKPWITVTNKWPLLVTYERNAMPTDFGLVAAVSSDGMAWKRGFIVDDPSGMTFTNLALPCAPRDGTRIWATYLAFSGNALNVLLSHSDDGGGSWSPGIVVSTPGEPVAFDDPMCVAENNEVWISYGLTMDMLDPSAGNASKLYAIHLAHSSDGGMTIDTHTNVQDAAAGKFYMHPQIFRELGGAIDLTYYAGNFDMDTNGTFRRSRAAVPPTGFGPSVVVDAPITFLQSRQSPGWLGDYTGLYARGTEIYMSFAVNDTGVSHIAFAKAIAQ
jgi:hypothetical protein